MNYIEQMVAELCPRGVEFREVQELFITRNGYTPSTANKAYWTDGTVPWFRMEDIRENGQILSESLQKTTEAAVKGGRLFPANSIIVATSATIGEHALITVPHLSNQRFTSLALRSEFSERVDMKFVFYYCFMLDEWCRNNTTTSSFASVDMSGFKKFRFPLPPLPIQQEIVRVLDKFSQLVRELQANLQAELVARRKQYQYYRDQLLSFEGREDVRWGTLGEIGSFIRGSGIQKSDFTDSGSGCIHYGQIHTHYGTWAKEVISFINPEFAARLRKAQAGDLVIATTSEDDKAVAKAVAWLGDEAVAVSTDAYIFRHTINPKYVSYFFQTELFQSQKKPHITGTKVRRISGESLSKIRIPIPSLEVQQEIVSILDKFDALVNDLSIGLPAEIAARQKQYEYYRDRLLTFPEAARTEVAVPMNRD